MASVDQDQERDIEKDTLPPPIFSSHDDDIVEKSNDPRYDATSSGKDESGVIIVNWNGDDDPEKPLNWPVRKKAPNIILVAAMTFLTPLASSMFAPGLPRVLEDFHSDNAMLGSFMVSIYILGFAFGPPMVAPLSELYGRLPVYYICSFLFIIFTVACALAKNIGMLMAFRLLAGLVGSCPITIGAGTIADLVPQERRGGIMAIWAMGPLLGPIIGPVAGGFFAQAEGWRWIFWLLAILGGVVLIFSLLFLRETYPPILLQRKVEALRKETGNQDIRSVLDKGLSSRELFVQAIIRPTKLLLLSPIILILSLYSATIYGVLYLLFTSFPETFEVVYGFSSGVVGLAYLGLGVGFILGLVICGAMSDAIVKILSAGGPSKPEYRLPLMVIGAACFPVGLFWYGWTADYRVHWIVPIIGTSFVGIGLISSFMSVGTYLVDAFTVYAASATAANTILRSMGGALLPLAGSPMFTALGLGWGCSVLGFISLLFCPAGMLIYRYGERIRKFQPQF